jgi:hypothetical protein
MNINAEFPNAVLTIFTSDAKEVVRITSNGYVVVNPEFTADEAARLFWEAVQKMAARKEES